MMTLTIGLAALALALFGQRLMLSRHARKLRAREQAFGFHAIRDDLQLLAVKGIVSPESRNYKFLISTTNLAIRNAGIMRVRDIIQIASRVNDQISGDRKAQFEREMQLQPEEFRQLAARVFSELTDMLVSNDTLVRLGFRFAVFVASAWRTCRPLLRWIREGAEVVARHVIPTKATAVEYAWDYHRIADRLAA